MFRFKHHLKDYFSFTRSETIGISALILIIIIILSLPYIYKHFKKENKTDFTEFDKQITEFQKELKKVKDTADYRQQKPNYKKHTIYNYKKFSAISNQPAANNYKTKSYFKKDNFTIELNSADSLGLMRLKGIGHSFAKRIINYRKLLGGYYKKEQLLEVWGMDTARYNMIKDYLKVNADSVNKININNIPFKKLLKHPYLKYDIAVALTNYKKQHGDFKDVNEIKNCSIITDSIFQKIAPYIKVK